jgi:hypothetical protein
MKSFLRHPISPIALLSMAFLSWSQLNQSKIAVQSSLKIKNGFPIAFSCPEESVLDAESYWDEFNSSDNHHPPAEDVLIQRIRGDNTHVLMMAFYSKENYPAKPSIIVNSGNAQLVFRDDGKGDDQTAGDGLFTAKIAADVEQFKREAKNIVEEMKRFDSKPLQFLDRSMIIDADKTSDFDEAAFDNFKTVSIAGLDNTQVRTRLDSLRANCIFITDLKVVEDPNRTWNACAQTGNVDGAWTFKTLMKQLASKDPQHIASDSVVSIFVKNWLNTWKKTKTINSDVVPARTLVNDKILKPWLNKSKANGSPQGQLDMKFAPFKLTAILNRFDLRSIFDGIPAGETRFIFCLIDSGCTKPEDFTMIIEYGIPKKDKCDSLMPWAQQWYNLKNLPLGSAQYNDALQNITDQFTLCGTNTKRVNQSNLNKIRTNDRALSPNPVQCEFREFVLAKAGNLTLNTVTDALADRYNVQIDNPATERMARWVNQNHTAITDSILRVPKTFEDSPFLGGKSTILGTTVGNPEKTNVYHWDGTQQQGPAFIRNGPARHTFSLNTCSGCHSGETQTNFTHVDPVFFGTQATLSGFLTGKAGQGGSYDFDGNPDNDSMMVEDAGLRPVSNPMVHMFNDILRRAKDLDAFVNTPCGSLLQIRNELLFKPVNMVH